MHRYRVLLIDTEVKYDRPQQALFNDLRSAHVWAETALKTASEHAEVMFYLTTEHELGVMRKSDDQSAVSGFPAAG
jgi:hypothetical protein